MPRREVNTHHGRIGCQWRRPYVYGKWRYPLWVKGGIASAISEATALGSSSRLDAHQVARSREVRSRPATDFVRIGSKPYR